MKLTEEIRARIDGMSYRDMLALWRFAPAGEPIFQDESGQYYSRVMFEKRGQVGPAEAVAASKSVGWDKGGE